MPHVYSHDQRRWAPRRWMAKEFVINFNENRFEFMELGLSMSSYMYHFVHMHVIISLCEQLCFIPAPQQANLLVSPIGVRALFLLMALIVCILPFPPFYDIQVTSGYVLNKQPYVQDKSQWIIITLRYNQYIKDTTLEMINWKLANIHMSSTQIGFPLQTVEQTKYYD